MEGKLPKVTELVKQEGPRFKGKPIYSKALALSTSHFLPVGGGVILRQEDASLKLYAEYVRTKGGAWGSSLKCREEKESESWELPETVGEQMKRGREAVRAQQLMKFYLLSLTSPSSPKLLLIPKRPGIVGTKKFDLITSELAGPSEIMSTILTVQIKK